MQTIVRTNPATGETRTYQEFSPHEIEHRRMAERAREMVARGHYKSEIGSPPMTEFIPDTGTRSARRKNH